MKEESPDVHEVDMTTPTITINRRDFTPGEYIEFIRFRPHESPEDHAVRIGLALGLGVVVVRKVATGRKSCPRCGDRKVPGTKCHGNDQCTEGEDGGPAECCEGWGRYCCRCGADFARDQM